MRFARRGIEQAVSQRFERQAELYPQRLAVKSRRRELTITPLPGNHGTILREPHVRVLARKLRAALDG